MKKSHIEKQFLRTRRVFLGFIMAAYLHYNLHAASKPIQSEKRSKHSRRTPRHRRIYCISKETLRSDKRNQDCMHTLRQPASSEKRPVHDLRQPCRRYTTKNLG